MHRGLFSTGAMGALAPPVFKIRLFSTRNFLTFYYCQVGVTDTVSQYLQGKNNP